MNRNHVSIASEYIVHRLTGKFILMNNLPLYFIEAQPQPDFLMILSGFIIALHEIAHPDGEVNTCDVSCERICPFSKRSPVNF